MNLLKKVQEIDKIIEEKINLRRRDKDTTPYSELFNSQEENIKKIHEKLQEIKKENQYKIYNIEQ